MWCVWSVVHGMWIVVCMEWLECGVCVECSVRSVYADGVACLEDMDGMR